MGDLEDLLRWMADYKNSLKTSAPMGALPDTAQAQYDKFQDSYAELERKEDEVKAMLLNGEDMVARCREEDTILMRDNLQKLGKRMYDTRQKAERRKVGHKFKDGEVKIICQLGVCESVILRYVCDCRNAHCTKKHTIHQVTVMLATSKNVIFPGHNHLLTTGTDDPTLNISRAPAKWLAWCLLGGYWLVLCSGFLCWGNFFGSQTMSYCLLSKICPFSAETIFRLDLVFM